LFVYEDLGAVEAKGFADPVRAWRCCAGGHGPRAGPDGLCSSPASRASASPASSRP
jgi:hypothetical protein